MPNTKRTPPSDPEPVQVGFRLWPGVDNDLIAWFRSLGDLPRGHKVERIKAALRLGIGTEDDLYQTVKAAVEEALTQQE